MFAPLFFGGLALLALPYLIHRIRRPEREAVRFSSLMFVPDVKREVIERRRVQHVLLMLVRMALLALLALAFARPFLEIVPGAETPVFGATDHAIVLDVSMSMSEDRNAPRAAARRALDEVKSGDRVGVVLFGRSGVVAAPLSSDVRAAQRAIDAAEPTWEAGDFAVALQAAEQMLAGDGERNRVIHLISDCQASGLPDGDLAWRLPAQIGLRPWPVGSGGITNASVEALSAQAINDSTVQVRARIKAWSGVGPMQVRLVKDGAVLETREITVPEGNASLVVFSMPRTSDVLTGYVEVVAEGDMLDRDNRRYFAHQPDPPHEVVLVRSERPVFERLIAAAVPQGARLPWRVEAVERSGLADALARRPAGVIAEGIALEMRDVLSGYVRGGGRLFLPLGTGAQTEILNALLEDSGVQIGESVRSQAGEPLSWVDLNHRVFAPFKGARYNDFSPVRFFAYRATTVDSPAVVPARFENGAPAMVDAPLGRGRVLIWTGGVDLAGSNLARSPRFVPLLHETLRHLSGTRVVQGDYEVGDPAPGDVAEGVVEGRFEKPGVFRRADGGFAVVNVDAAESDPARIAPVELDIRMAQAPVLHRGTRTDVSGVDVVRREYGYWGIVALFVLLLVEHGMAVCLRTRQERAS